MKTFKLKDLLVAVLPEGEEGQTELACPAPTCGTISCNLGTCPLNTCRDFTCQNTCIGRTCLQGTNCPAYSCTDFSRCLGQTCYIVTRGPLIDQPLEDLNLSELKRELQSAMEQVEAKERQAEARSRPRSLEEAEALEKKLRDALHELEVHKQGLKG